ncbi:hypothetical protein GYM46_09195 [Brevundimonas mediterranea]|jgi:hypothetical protein|uniref:Uncharacterized protein n=1 Tax=Brevundimonas mediterranea TaxID=74329 RepID=A0AB37E841_9CAUL|nr:hypothetical protein [Brevundimonas mediterranea]QIH73107.1 hypothetical protein GYM46_09195 [Brevundimonas mediterranea]
MAAKDVPIACTLGAGDYQERVRWIADLNQRSLQSHRRDDLTLHIDYEAGALADVEELVRKETACCAFLTFEIEPRLGSVCLVVTAPEDARLAADTLFEDFIASGPSTQAQTRGCC